MIVTEKNFHSIVDKLSRTGVYAVDTETTGLEQSDRLFSIIVADSSSAYYFNFQDYPEEKILGLPRRECLRLMRRIFENKGSAFVLHNAKFDLRMLRKEGIEIQGSVHCTEAIARVIQNNLIGYSLAQCAKRIGISKDDGVAEYIKKHKLWEWQNIPGKKKRVKKPFFDKVPFNIIVPYGEQDALVTLKLYKHQQKRIVQIEKHREQKYPYRPSIHYIVDNEKELTKTLAAMEAIGMKLRREYTEDALAHESALLESSKLEFQEATGVEFLDSNKVLAEVFTKLGEEFPKTEKGNPSFDKHALASMDSPVAKLVKKIRGHDQKIGTYYSSFLYFAGSDDIIHPNMRQGGTETGRLSYSEPNLQNVPKEDLEEDLKKPFLVRACFEPRPDFCFTMIDYDQQEFRMMLDYAGEKELIGQINEGADVHQATADMVGISRKKAKTLNFGLLYGMGVGKLANALKIPEAEAKHLREQYFARLPMVKKFIRNVTRIGESRRYVWNWKGRVCRIASPDFAYILPNHIIQGGCADVIKVAMNKIQGGTLRGKKSRTIITVHDELLFEIHKDELDLVPKLKRDMEEVYQPRNGMLLTCSVEHSWKSWGTADKISGLPNG